MCHPGASLDTLRVQGTVALNSMCGWPLIAHGASWAPVCPPSITRTPSRSVNGDVRFFDPRLPESVNVLQIVKGLTALDIHPQANLIAW